MRPPRAALALLPILFAVPPAVARPATVRRATTVPAERFAELRYRSIGPYRAGWATSVAGIPGDRRTFYFGAAGGGVWRTRDAGLTWEPLMDREPVAAIGAIAVAPSDPRVIYAGTGQEGTRYDLMSGEGVYRSTDAGASWAAAGLAATRQIGAVLVDPADARRVLVAAIGHAFAPNVERGVFLTTDGGDHWRHVLAPGDSVGAVDLAGDPAEPRVVYAATWQMRMRPWMDYFVPQSGPGSGVWRSDDGGEHWVRLAGGLPTGAVGRIGLAVAPGSRGRMAYALVATTAGAQGEAGLYATHDGGATWALVHRDGSLPSGYFGRLTVAPDDSNVVYVMSQSIRRSKDGGVTFEVFRGSPGGDDYHHLWIDPRDPAVMITGSDQGAVVTLNGGATWSSWYNQPTGQFYHLAADEQFPYHVFSGQQDNGTVEIASRGPYGVIEERDWHPVGGDERDYMVPKPGDPRTVFGSGLGGGVSRFDEVTRQSRNVSPWPIGSYGARPGTTPYRYSWITPLALSPVPPHAMYMGAQVLFRSFDDGQHWDEISPDLSGRREGASGCDDPDPARARDCGFGVISAIAPSPLDADRLWVGTDDGRIHLTRDAGRDWRDVTPPQLPAWGIVFAIDASPFDTASAYAAVDLHRLDRHEPLLLRTHDGGRTWRTITGGLPADEFTSVVRTDREREGLLFAGTQRGVHVSFDDGENWQPFSANLPSVWVRDLLVHHGDLIVGTQGRGIWVLDDVSPLREWARGGGREPVGLTSPATAVRLRSSESHDTPWPPETPLGENPPTGAVLDYWLDHEDAGGARLWITDSTGAVVRRFSSRDTVAAPAARRYFDARWVRPARRLAAGAGGHRFVWDLRREPPETLERQYSIGGVWTAGTPVVPAGALVVPGRYTVTLESGGRSVSRPLRVVADPRLELPPGALESQDVLHRAADSVLVRAVRAHRAVRAERGGDGVRGTADADSLDRIADGLAGAARQLTGLIANLEAADGDPPQGLRRTIAALRRQVDGLLERHARLRAGKGGTEAR